MTTIRQIVTHRQPHPDELYAIWLLKRFGNAVFPGVETAPIAYWPAGRTAPDGRSAAAHEVDGTLCIGVGGGRFDEHPNTTEARVEGRCAATLVADALGLTDEVTIERLLRFVTKNDTQGSGGPFDLAAMVQVLHRSYPEDPDRVLAWAFTAFDAHHADQVAFWTTAREEYECHAQALLEFSDARGQEVRLVIIASDDTNVARYARAKLGGNADVVVQRRTTGHVQVFARRWRGIHLHEAARLIRTEERRRAQRTDVLRSSVLTAEGVVPGAEHWHLAPGHTALLNGSVRNLEVPPTTLPLATIVDLVTRGVRVREALQPPRP